MKVCLLLFIIVLFGFSQIVPGFGLNESSTDKGESKRDTSKQFTLEISSRPPSPNYFTPGQKLQKKNQFIPIRKNYPQSIEKNQNQLGTPKGFIPAIELQKSQYNLDLNQFIPKVEKPPSFIPPVKNNVTSLTQLIDQSQVQIFPQTTVSTPTSETVTIFQSNPNTIYTTDPRIFQYLNVTSREWYQYQIKYNKRPINSQEQFYRLMIYARSKQQVQRHNANLTKLYWKGINQFSDLTNEEYVKFYLGSRLEPFRVPTIIIPQYDQYQTNAQRSIKPPVLAPGKGGPPPQTFVTPIDWRKRGIFHNVEKKQGKCGSCYVFASIAGIQTHVMIKKLKKVILSEQQLIDCCSKSQGYDCYGCAQGTLRSGFDYSKDYGNIDHYLYPYSSQQGTVGSCKYSFHNPNFYLNPNSPYTIQYPGLKYEQTWQHLKRFPVVAIVDATTWAPYKEGVFDDCSNYPKLNHGVLIAGVESTGSWIVKNWFGVDWGYDGFMILDQKRNCGINTVIVIPRLVPPKKK